MAQKSMMDYAKFYPIGEYLNIRYLSSYTKQETVLLEASATIRYSVYNDFLKGLADGRKHTQAWYLSFRPQIRSYYENSLPFKSPGYRIFAGTQHLFRLPEKEPSLQNKAFIGFSLESGHYSNGQTGCAFSGKYADGSPECDSICKTIRSSTNLSEILNRKNGDFSTNLTEVILNYRRYGLNNKGVPYNMHSLSLGYVLYQNRLLGFGNIGGYSEEEIRIYGKHRFLVQYEYMHVFKQGEGVRISIKQHAEIIYGAHRHVNPLRTETTFIIYPFIHSKKNIINPNTIGFFAGYIYGHDNYNNRFVDSGHQGTIGISWNPFPPFPIKNKIIN